MKTNDSQVVVINKVEQTRQKQNNLNTGEHSPLVSFKSLIDIYKNSFIVPGLVKKVATAINTGFESDNKQAVDFLDKIDQDFLNRNLFLLGNCFFEILRNNALEITGIEPVIGSKVLILENGDGFVQRNGNTEIFYNKFTEKEKIPLEIQKWVNSGSPKNLISSKEGAGYNPSLTEIYHFKNTSLSDFYFGDSDFEGCIDQLILLELIDSYFENFFENGIIKNKLIFPKGDKAFGPRDKKTIEAFIQDKMVGIKKSFGAVVLDKEIGSLDLEHDIDPQKFLEYRQKLMESISISLNIPFGIIISVNSNKASSQTDYKTFLQNLVFPLQKRNIIDLKKILKENFGDVEVKYKKIETTDEKENMEILTGYKTNGCLTANEVRTELGKEEKEGGDILETSKSTQNLQNTNQDPAQTDIILQKFNKIQDEFRNNY